MGPQQEDRCVLRPFRLPWLDSSYQETLLPDAPWHQVRDLLCDKLAEKIEKHLDNDKRRQMIFEMVGPRFAQKYFPNYDNDPQLLEPPQLSAENRQKVFVETENWLKVAMHQTTADVQCQPPDVVQDEEAVRAAMFGTHGLREWRPALSDGYKYLVGDVAVEMDNFLHHTKATLTRGLQRHLYLRDEALVNKSRAKLEAIEQLREDGEMWRKWQRAEGRRWKETHIKGILKHPQTQPPALPSHVGGTTYKPPPTPQIKAALYVPASQPPLWGRQAESLGRALVAVLTRDPGHLAEVAWRLHGRQLPGTLRSYIFFDVLLSSNRKEHKGSSVNVERLVRAEFGKLVARGRGEMRVRHATNSPISSLIDRALVEVYDVAPGMRAYQADHTHMRDAARALNVLHCFDRSYQPALVSRLFPLQLAFREHAGQSEHAYDLALYLHLLHRGCFPTPPTIVSIARIVLESLRVADEEFVLHLENIAQTNPREDSENLTARQSEAKEPKQNAGSGLASAGSGSASGQANAAVVLTDPLIYLRQWITEGFVGVLDTPAALWLWDQLFLENWQQQSLVDICLALLLLLRHRFLAASDAADLAQVFQTEPCKLYTKDIQRAWMHLQYGGHPTEVPDLNRRRPKSDDSCDSTLEPVGVKAVVVSLVFSEHTLNKCVWLASFDPEELRLVCSVYLGTTRLDSQISTHPAQCLLGARSLPGGSTGYKVYFLKTVLEFSGLDPSQLDVEQEVDGRLHATLRVDYIGHEDTKAGRAPPITLGWAALRLYSLQPAGGAGEDEGLEMWEVDVGDQDLQLVSGSVPDTAGGTPLHDSPDPAEDMVYIEADSTLRASVFSLRQKVPPPSPVPTPLYQRPSSPHSPDLAIPTVNHGFNLYIDGVDNIPDTATICKVTGRVIKTGALSGMPDILALPIVTHSARSPRFDFRLVINADRLPANRDMLVLLRVYTVNKHAKGPRALCVIGSCLFGFFDSDGVVRVGVHHCPLHTGMPNLSHGEHALTSQGLEHEPRIPACTISLRLTRNTPEAEPPADGLEYVLDGAPLSESEERVIQSYTADNERMDEKIRDAYPASVSDMVSRLKQQERDNSADLPRVWIRERLDQRKHLAQNQPALQLPLAVMVEYRPAIGISVQVTGAHALPEGRYAQAVVWLALGNKTTQPAPDADRYEFRTSTHDYDARQAAPVWLDEPTTIRPSPDPYTCLLVQVLGLQAVYHPTDGNASPGTVTGPAGGPVTLDDDAITGWAIVPLMQGAAVWSGHWRVPILRKRPSSALLAELSAKSVGTTFEQRKWAVDAFLDGASLDVKVWDSHFMPPEQLSQGFKEEDLLIDKAGVVERCSLMRNEKGGKMLHQMVLDTLGRKYRKLGTKSFIYQQERTNFAQVMEETVTTLLNESNGEVSQS